MGTMAIISLIFAILGTAATIGSNIYANQQNKEIQNQNIETARETREDSQDFAREQQQSANAATMQMFNIMDSPEAKVRQLKNAGLSVGLMYGNGGMGGSHSSQMGNAPAATPGITAPYINPILNMLTNPMDALKAVKQSEKTDTEIDTMEQQQENMKKQNEAITQQIIQSQAEVDKILSEKVGQDKRNEILEYEKWNAEFDKMWQQAERPKKFEILKQSLENLGKEKEKLEKLINGLEIENTNKDALMKETITNLNSSAYKNYAEAILAQAQKEMTEALKGYHEQMKDTSHAQMEVYKSQRRLSDQNLENMKAEYEKLQNDILKGDWELANMRIKTMAEILNGIMP